MSSSLQFRAVRLEPFPECTWNTTMGVGCWRIQQDLGVTWYTVGRLAKEKRTKQNTGMNRQRDAFTRSKEKLAKIKFHRGFDKRKSWFFSSSHRGRRVCPAAVSRLQKKSSPHNIGQTRVSVEPATSPTDRPTDFLSAADVFAQNSDERREELQQKVDVFFFSSSSSAADILSPSVQMR